MNTVMKLINLKAPSRLPLISPNRSRPKVVPIPLVLLLCPPPLMVIPGYVPVAVRYDSDIDRALHLLCKDMQSIDCKVNNVKLLTNVFIF